MPHDTARELRALARLEELTDDTLTFRSAYRDDAPVPTEALDTTREKEDPLVLALDHVSNIGQAKSYQPDVGLRVLVWNVANLGGKFGYPVCRSEEVIQATAEILHAANADAIFILEVLQHSRPDPEPRPPFVSKQSSRGEKDQGWVVFVDEYAPGVIKLEDKGGGDESKKKRKTATRKARAARKLAEMFFHALNALLWPGDDSSREARVWSRLPDESRDEVRRNFGFVRDLITARLAPAPEEDDDSEDALDEDAATKARNEGWARLGERPAWNRTTPISEDRRQLKWIRAGLPWLAQEGLSSFLDEPLKELKPQGEKNPDTKSRTARNRRRKALRDALHALVEELWSRFVSACVGPQTVKRNKRLSYQTEEEAPEEPHSRWLHFISLLERYRKTDFDRRHAAWEAARSSTASKNVKHPGLSEFLRIAEALKNAGGTYSHWPTDENDVRYHLGETYGVLWRPSRLEACGAPEFLETAVGTRLKGLHFQKRQPISARFRVKDDNGASGPEVELIGWHAPSPSKANTVARSSDFPSFLSYARQAREEGGLGVVLADFNINTRDTSGKIEHCNSGQQKLAFFEELVGTEELKRLDKRTRYDRQSRVLSTMAKTRFKDPVDDDDDFLVKVTDVLGASSYDKILPYARHGTDWKLYLKGFTPVPVPIALRKDGETGGLFEDVDGTHGEVLKPFNRLFGAPKYDALRDKLFTGAPKGTGLEKTRQAYAARKLSDHFPVIADLLVRHVDVRTRAQRQKSTTTPGNRDIEHDRRLLEEWCFHLVESAGTPWRGEAFAALMSHWEAARSLHGDQAALALLEATLTASCLDDPERKAPVEGETWWPKVDEDTIPRTEPVGNTTIFVTEANKGGGDCLFRTLGQVVFGDEELHEEIRRALMAFLRRELAAAGRGQTGLVGSVERADFIERLRVLHEDLRAGWPGLPLYRAPYGVDVLESWAAQMAVPGTWGDTIVLALASAYFGIRFHVWVRSEGVHSRYALSFAGGDDPPLRTIVCTDCVHFEAGGPRSDDDEPLSSGMVTRPETFEDDSRRRSLLDVRPPPETDDTGDDDVMDARPTFDGDHRVVPWDISVPWTLDDATDFPDALFVFSELASHKGQRVRPGRGQAVLRPAENAVGIRVREDDDTEPDDSRASTYEQWWKEDFDEVLAKLRTGRYGWLVLPSVGKGGCALGVDGTAGLVDKAPGSGRRLAEFVEKLSDEAGRLLTSVLIVPCHLPFVDGVVDHRDDRLFVAPTNLAFWVGGLVRATANAFYVPVSPSPLHSFAEVPGEEKALVGAIHDAYSAIARAVRSGAFRAIELQDVGGRSCIVAGAEKLKAMGWKDAAEALEQGWKALCDLAMTTRPPAPKVSVSRKRTLPTTTSVTKKRKLGTTTV